MNIELKCNYCDKIYKSNSARILHYRKNHNELYEKDKLEQNNKKEYKCLNCSKTFTSRQAKHYHIKKCVVEKKDDMAELKNMVSHLEETVSLLSKQLNTKLNINNGTINNINNNINNGTINYAIINFGSEEQVKKLISKNQFIQIVKKGRFALDESISLVHLNENRLELNNIIITDLYDDYAYVFNKNENKFIVRFKEEVLEELIDKHVNIIETTFEKYKEFITEEQQVPLLYLFKKIDEEKPFYHHGLKKTFNNYKDYKKETAKIKIYNYGNKMAVNIEFNSNSEITV
jgi:hypothetical protein